MKAHASLMMKTSLTLVALTVLAISTPSVYGGGPWYVAPGGDDNNTCASPLAPCATINIAIAKASAGDVVYVAAGTYTCSSNGQIKVVSLDRDAILSGGWDQEFAEQNGTSIIKGDNCNLDRRGVVVKNGVTAVIDYFTIQDNFTLPDPGGRGGAGVSNDGDLTLRNCILTNNGGHGPPLNGGGIYNAGHLLLEQVTMDNNHALSGNGSAIFNTGTIEITDAIFNENSIHNTGTMTVRNAFFSSSGIYNAAGTMMVDNAVFFSDGIRNDGTIVVTEATFRGDQTNVKREAVLSTGTMTLDKTTVAGYSSNYGGGGICNYGNLVVKNSTISDNTTSGENGYGGGLYNAEGRTDLINSTISNNSAEYGGGIYNDSGVVNLSNCTITGNSANQGGGIKSVSGSVVLRNTILGRNLARTKFGPDCHGDLVSQGYNIVEHISACGFAVTTGDLVNTDPCIGGLRDNNGSTETHALVPGSPAIDAGNPTGCLDQDGNPLDSDQRGVTRVGRCDIGSFESVPGEAVTSVPYFPLQPGTRWRYLINGKSNQKVEVLHESKIIRGNQTAVLYYPKDGSKEYYTNDARGIRLHRIFVPNVYIPGLGSVDISETFIPPMKLAEGLVEIGESCGSKGVIETNSIPQIGVVRFRYNATFTLQGFDTVTVPAGSFEALRVAGTYEVDGDEQSDVIHLAKGFGIIRWLTSVRGGVGTRELVSTTGTTTLLAPNGGEVVASGGGFDIAWEATPNLTRFQLMYSLNNGIDWIPIEGAESVTGNVFGWAVPALAGNKATCRVMVIANGATADDTNSDISDKPFTIEVLKLTFPNGSETLISGKTLPVTWRTNETSKPVAKVKLYYTVNGGYTWKSICDPSTGEPFLANNPGSFQWIVPTVLKDKSRCKVKVVLKDMGANTIGMDMSDSYFSIKPGLQE